MKTLSINSEIIICTYFCNLSVNVIYTRDWCIFKNSNEHLLWKSKRSHNFGERDDNLKNIFN